jgi:putative redox protein
MAATVTAHIEKDHYKTQLSNGRTGLIADEPLSLGGTDLGFSPTELLCSALATCTCVTLRMYADRKQWPLESVHTEVNATYIAAEKRTELLRTIQLAGPLDAEQRQRLMEIANKCAIHNVLTQDIDIQTNIIE